MTIASGPGAGTAYTIEPFAYSDVGHVSAEVVDLAGGAESDYNGKDVTGKIVVLERVVLDLTCGVIANERWLPSPSRSATLKSSRDERAS